MNVPFKVYSLQFTVQDYQQPVSDNHKLQTFSLPFLIFTFHFSFSLVVPCLLSLPIAFLCAFVPSIASLPLNHSPVAINTALVKSNFPFSQKLLNNTSSARYTTAPLPISCTPKITPFLSLGFNLLPTKPAT